MAPIIGREQLNNPLESAVVVLLVWVAGSLDAISYLGLGHVFTANMTGNTVLLGLSLGAGNAAAALRSVLALAGFCLGVVAAALIVERKLTSADWTASIVTALCIELFVLAGFAAVWPFCDTGQENGTVLYLLILLASAAMGIQATAVQHLKLPGIPTIVITTTLTTCIIGLVVGARHKDNEFLDGEKPVGWNRKILILQALAIAVYCCSAMFNGIVEQWWPSLFAIPPLIALAAALAGASVLSRRKSGASG
jgi:uncharacterized membrane protein YoaK (UPF0700 family)